MENARLQDKHFPAVRLYLPKIMVTFIPVFFVNIFKPVCLPAG